MREDRIKYNNLLRRLNNIKIKYGELNSRYSEMISNQKKSLLIDKKIVDSDDQKTINNNVRKCLNELNGIVIPSVKRKI